MSDDEGKSELLRKREQDKKGRKERVLVFLIVWGITGLVATIAAWPFIGSWFLSRTVTLTPSRNVTLHRGVSWADSTSGQMPFAGACEFTHAFSGLAATHLSYSFLFQM